MTLALLQPVFAPNLYDLACMLQAERVILQDLDTWSRKGRVHRALVRTSDGTTYLHIPVRTTDRDKPICDVRIDQDREWVAPILKTLRYNYRNSLYYDYYEPEITADLKSGSEHDYLLPFVLFLRKRLLGFLELDLSKKEMPASACESYDPDPDRFASNFGAGSLFQEHDSLHYQRQALSRKEPVFKHPVYRQHFDGFEPWCSLYDILFQYGPESFRITDQLSGDHGVT